MPRIKKFGVRKVHNNQHINNKKDGNVNDTTPTPDGLEEKKVSSSERKLSSRKCLFKDFSEEMQINDGVLKSGYQLIDLQKLSIAVNNFTKCKYCDGENCLSVGEVVNKRKGLACSLVILCDNCKKHTCFDTSKKTDNGFEVNLRFVFGLRCIGKGREGGKVLCGAMNLPNPATKFKSAITAISNSVEKCAEESMKQAASEAIEENNGSTNIAVAVDGSWQRRGHKSLNGVVTATSVDTGKVLDIDILTKYCHGCNKNKDNDKHESECVVNYSGSSGGMEVEGAVNIFSRSVDRRGVQYTEYLGDGDSKGYNAVVEAKPYGDTLINKLECVGHVHKRMGARLRRVVQDMKGKKLADGKPIGGKNRLTGGEINKLQDYYGNAIRSNTDNLEAMRKAVWCTWFHKASTDDNPMHSLCPKNSWCQYNRDPQNYKHHGLPNDVMEAIKPVYRDLSKPDLLKRCLHGKTQNVNESFNNLIWNRIPKGVFVGFITLKLGVLDAIINFNEGCMGRLKVLEDLGLSAGYNTVSSFEAIDKLRIHKANKSLEIKVRELRKKKRMSNDEDEDLKSLYEPGGF